MESSFVYNNYLQQMVENMFIKTALKKLYVELLVIRCLLDTECFKAALFAQFNQ